MTYIYSPKDPRLKFNYLIKEIFDPKFKKTISCYLDYLAKETIAYQVLEQIEKKYQNRKSDLNKKELESLCKEISFSSNGKKIKGTEFLVIILGLKTSRLPRQKELLDFLIEHGALKIPSLIKEKLTFKEAFAKFNIPSISRFNKAWEPIMRTIFKDKLKKYPQIKIVDMLEAEKYGVGDTVKGIRIGACDDTLVYKNNQFLVEYKGTVEGNQGRIIKDRIILEATTLLKHKKNKGRYYIAIITGPGLNKNLAKEIKRAMRNKRFFLAGATSFDRESLKIDSIEEMLNKIRAKF